MSEMSAGESTGNKFLKDLLSQPAGQGQTGAHLKKDAGEAPPKFNSQLYKNSGLGEMSQSDAPLSQFFNSKEPNLAVFHEKPEHRLMLYMKAQGCSNREIAQHSGYTEPWVSQLFRQPWAREILLALMNEVGKNRVEVLLKGAAEDSVLTLIDLRDNPETNSGVRRAAADSLLDRFLGKPKQSVEVHTTQSAESIQELDKELEQLAQEESRLLGSTAHGEAGV